jgi:hypothetical protein
MTSFQHILASARKRITPASLARGGVIAACIIAASATLVLSSSTKASGPPTLTVTAVTASGALTLSDGQTIALAHAQLPVKTAMSEACGADVAHAQMVKLTVGKDVQLTSATSAMIGGKDVATEIVRAGWATPDVVHATAQTSARIMAASEEARVAGRGWWQTCAPAQP